MTALAADRQGNAKAFSILPFTLTAGTKAYKGGLAVIVIGAGTVSPGSAATGRVVIGTFAETVDATAGAKTVAVQMQREITATWLAAHSVSAPVATDIGRICYVQDDQTVTMADTGRSIAGRVWAVDATKGILVEYVTVDGEYLAALRDAVAGATLTFTTNNVAVTAAQLVNGAVFACPATDAASTITLATTSVDTGTQVTFTFDGTANDFDVAIRYGTTNIVVVPAGTVAAITVVKHAAAAWQVQLGHNPLAGGAFPAHVSNDVIVTAAEIIHGAYYTLPELAANSTVTLPITGVADGTTISVIAASPGAYTVTYRYGTTAITTAITASRAHYAILTKLGSAWYANVYIGP